MAGGIGGLRAAYIEEAGAVGELDHVIDMGVDADVLVQVLAGLHHIEAGPGGRRQGG